ncbi:MAG: bifunctional precorrin-2 dehydrogenase/sirohydrochlorin ferrochelatase [Chloroflexi bacterium]|nr:bifunctional precorrin-2 dehydrogenase/sirohydrochlorin ferrochelatase [Chloroflexota bacterium]
MTAYYPIFLNIEGRRCVVVGGGDVAERKARSLLEHGASVAVISPSFSQGLQAMAQRNSMQVVSRSYQYGDLKDAVVAIAATDDKEVNTEVAREGKERGILINVVDDAQLSNFIVPSLVRRGDISIAISTSGKSPALARRIRIDLEKRFSQEYALLAELISEIRQDFKTKGCRINPDAWQRSLDLDVLLDMLKKGQYQAAKAKLLRELESKGAAAPSP